MRRLAIAVVLVGGCDSNDALGDEESSSSEITGIEPDAETFGEESESTGDEPLYPDGEMFGFCEVDEDCIDGVGYCELGLCGWSEGISCIADTCVQWHDLGTSIPAHGWTQGEGPSPCSEQDAVPVLNYGVQGYGSNVDVLVCGLRGAVADGLGYCDGGMTPFVAGYDDPSRDSITCWQASEILSGPTCADESDCTPCMAQTDPLLPSVCG